MKAININWDTDGENVNLPNEVEIPHSVYAECDGYGSIIEHVSDWLTDTYGFCHYGFEVQHENYSYMDLLNMLYHGVNTDEAMPDGDKEEVKSMLNDLLDILFKYSDWHIIEREKFPLFYFLVDAYIISIIYLLESWTTDELS